MYSVKLFRITEKIMNYVNEQVELEQAQTMEEVFPLLESVTSLFPNSVAMVCPFHHPEIRFVSTNCRSVFGYDATYIREHMNIEKFYTLVHPDDGEDLHAAFLFLGELLQEQLPQDQHKIRVIFQYRFLRKDGQYITVQDEKGILKLSNNKSVYYNIFRDITNETSFSGVQLSVYKQEDGLVKIAGYNPSKKNKLSKRERDIVSLIRHGLTNKEIAYRLNISHNTSRNIRSKLFEKFRVNNVVELLNVAV